MNTVSIRTTI